MTKVIRFLNILYLAIAATAITMYFAVPFIKVDAYVTINKEEITTLLEKTDGAEGLTVSDIFSEDEEITASINLDLAPSIIIKAFSDEADDIINKNLIEENIKSIVDSLKEPIRRVAEAILKKTGKDLIKNELQNAGLSIENISDEQINQSADKILEAAKAEGATVDSVANTVKEEVDKILMEAGVSTELDIEEIKSKLEEELSKYGAIKEDGTIQNVDIITGSFLYDILSDPNSPLNGGGSNSSNSSNSSSTSTIEAKSLPNVVVYNEDTPSGELTPEQKYAEVENLLAAQIKAKLPDQFIAVSTNVFKGMLFVLILFVGSWLVLLILILSRTFRHKKCYIKIRLWFWAIGFLQLILGVGLVIASKFSFKLINSSGVIIAPLNGTMFSNMNFTVTTAMFIPGILFIALIPISIIYKHFRKKLVKQIKIDKAVEQKMAELKENKSA